VKHEVPGITRRNISKIVLLGTLAFVLPALVSADPPSWAPAHGWRKKNDPEYVGYTGRKWDRDYGVVTGRCDYEAVGAVVGGAVGGAVGAKVGSKEDRPIAILVGAVIGSVVGARIGRSIEEADRACIGQSLELVKDGQRVTWRNPKTGGDYLLTPGAGFKKGDQTCREFSLRTTLKGKSQDSTGKACRTSDGAWKVLS